MSKKANPILSFRLSSKSKKTLKKEANEKNMTLSEYLNHIIQSRHNKIDEINSMKNMYKVTTVDYVMHDIETIKNNFESHEELFDGTDGWIGTKLVSVEEINMDGVKK